MKFLKIYFSEGSDCGPGASAVGQPISRQESSGKRMAAPRENSCTVYVHFRGIDPMPNTVIFIYRDLFVYFYYSIMSIVTVCKAMNCLKILSSEEKAVWSTVLRPRFDSWRVGAWLWWGLTACWCWRMSSARSGSRLGSPWSS